MNEENISLSPMIQSQFAFSYMNYSLSFTPQSFGNILLPYSIIDMAFYGLNFDKDISLDTDKSHFKQYYPLHFHIQEILINTFLILIFHLKILEPGLVQKF